MLLGIDTILDAPTGAGKTLAFYYALFYHCWTGSNEEGDFDKLLLVLSPLVGLMKSQVGASSQQHLLGLILFSY